MMKEKKKHKIKKSALKVDKFFEAATKLLLVFFDFSPLLISNMYFFFPRENTSPTATLKSPYPTLSLALTTLLHI